MTALDVRPAPPKIPEAVTEVWEHRFIGPALKLVAAYVVLIEIVAQFILGRVQFGFLDLGLQDGIVPRTIWLNGAIIGLLYGLLGMGLILVYRANRIINFAQAALGAVPAVLCLQLINAKNVNYWLTIPILLVTAGVLGFVVDVFIMRRFRSAPRLIATVATIGVSLLLTLGEVVVQKAVTGDLITSAAFETPFSNWRITIGKLVYDGNFLVAIIVTVGICAGMGAFFRYTDMGIAVRASAENGERASLLGIPVARVSTLVWILASLMSAMAIFLRAPMVGLTVGSSIGPSVLLYGLAAAVIARMDSLPMCVVAGMGIGMLDQGAVWATNKGSLSQAMMLVVILVALLAQKGAISRAMDAGVATWQSAREYKPIPTELRDVREVVFARGAMLNVALFISVILPLMLPERFAGRFAQVVIFAIVGVSLVILTGWAGQISLGQFAFAGVGSLVASGMAVRGWDFFVCLLAAGLAGALAAVLVGLPALRIQGLFLAVTTLAFAFTVEKLLLNPEYFDWWLPELGQPVARPKLYGQFSTLSDTRFYFVCLAFLGLALLVARSIRKYRFGRVLIGTRDNGRAVQAYGVNLARTRLTAFAISGFIAAVAGGLLAFQLQSIDAGNFTPDRSVAIFTIAAIGGLTSLPGAILGAVFVEGIPFLFDGNQNVRLITSSVGLLFLLMFVPGGLSQLAYGTRDSFLRWVARRNDIHVPSLLADSLVDDSVDDANVAERDLFAAAQAPDVEVIEDVELLGCPVCGARIPLAEAKYHPHFGLDAGSTSRTNGNGLATTNGSTRR